ncbi:MAG TPA: GFA family protein [Polyangiaceae bacterium]|nr:GFA family protein [Polyangiaceae bacterium]
MSNDKQYQGRCFCGSVELAVTGAPVAMGYCHCSSCRQWAAAPVNAFTLWQPTAVKVTKGADLVAGYARSPSSVRKWCKTCGGHLFTEHPGFQLTDVYAAVIPDLPFSPGVHVNYGETVLRLHDGLVKQKDFPKEMGGSGTVLGD